MTVSVFAPLGASATRITVEAVLLSAAEDGLRFRVRTSQLPDGGHPDTLARELAGFAEDVADPARLLHSTSWRFDGTGVVLTYAALPDPDPQHATPLDADHALPYAVDPLAPSLDRLTVQDVALHACRHLAYLRLTDPVVSLTAAEAPRLWSMIATLTPAVAGLVTQPDLASARDR
jgi:hypothetical protein